MACRYTERFIAGCYRRQNLSYEFAVDETPAYRTVLDSRNVTSFFSWKTRCASARHRQSIRAVAAQ